MMPYWTQTQIASAARAERLETARVERLARASRRRRMSRRARAVALGLPATPAATRPGLGV